ncbi:hypothetical protein EON65_26905 [archaeon]|nr:MAG: hypothetical protein EON65_26905 [archaeon]
MSNKAHLDFFEGDPAHGGYVIVRGKLQEVGDVGFKRLHGDTSQRTLLLKNKRIFAHRKRRL